MGAKLHDLGVDVQWNTELIAFQQQPDHVDVTLKQPDGSTRKLTAAWVAGCDGGRSAVRDMSGITFPGAPYEHTFFVADTEAIGPMKPGELNVYLWQDGFHLFFPMRGQDRWRVIGILPKALRTRTDLSFEDLTADIRREAGAELSFKACDWFSTYRIHHRCAERFRDRRCFLLGDAAHVHSPAGGQGMNTGLQDAYNLGWKLALVVKGQADAELLDSYEQERQPVAQRLLRTTDRIFTLLVSDSWVAGLFRTRILARILSRAMSVERIRTVAFRTISQIGIRYRKGPLSQMLARLPEGAPVAGDRFPWLHLKLQPNGPVEDLFQKFDDTRFNLLVIGQPVPAAGALGVGDLIRVHAVPDDPANASELARVHVTGPAFYLLRPDGHIGLAARELTVTDVKRYLAQHHLRVDSARAEAGELGLRVAA